MSKKKYRTKEEQVREEKILSIRKAKKINGKESVLSWIESYIKEMGNPPSASQIQLRLSQHGLGASRSNAGHYLAQARLNLGIQRYIERLQQSEKTLDAIRIEDLFGQVRNQGIFWCQAGYIMSDASEVVEAQIIEKIYDLRYRSRDDAALYLRAWFYAQGFDTSLKSKHYHHVLLLRDTLLKENRVLCCVPEIELRNKLSSSHPGLKIDLLAVLPDAETSVLGFECKVTQKDFDKLFLGKNGAPSEKMKILEGYKTFCHHLYLLIATDVQISETQKQQIAQKGIGLAQIIDGRLSIIDEARRSDSIKLTREQKNTLFVRYVNEMLLNTSVHGSFRALTSRLCQLAASFPPQFASK